MLTTRLELSRRIVAIVAGRSSRGTVGVAAGIDAAETDPRRAAAMLSDKPMSGKDHP